MAALTPKVRRALRGVALSEADAAAAELAVHYAQAIDRGGEGDDLTRLGPALLASLEALGMTPRARRSLVKGATSGGPASPLDEIRAKHRSRAAG